MSGLGGDSRHCRTGADGTTSHHQSDRTDRQSRPRTWGRDHVGGPVADSAARHSAGCQPVPYAGSAESLRPAAGRARRAGTAGGRHLLALRCRHDRRGASGFGAFIAAFPSFAVLAGWLSSGLVFVYSGALLAGALLQARARGAASPPPRSRASCAIASALALAFLNPQVYFEMVGVVGSVAIRFAEAERVAFALGVMLVSPLWFFGLALARQRWRGCCTATAPPSRWISRRHRSCSGSAPPWP